MGDKFDGALAGGGRSSSAEVAIPEALQDLALNETLVAADESGRILLLRAVQNPYHGGVMMIAEPGEVGWFTMMEAIKLSQMTSMLNDADRCSKYAQAIRSAVQKRCGSCVLDIGTGTGLLAMLAARSGARHVDAVEMFQPMADLASRVINDNQLETKISVHAAKSTELLVRSPSDDQVKGNVLTEKSDILVTEIFDSVLLGEACLPVIAHAREQLLKDDAIVIPTKAVLYGTLLQSDFCLKFQNLGSDFPLHRSANSKSCLGGTRGIPLHFEAVEEGRDYKVLTEQFEIFSFDFAARDLDKYLEHRRSESISRIKQGTPNTLLTWWELDLTGDGNIIYSTKPGVENWQDHWLPVVYPLPSKERAVADDECIPLTMGHDQISFWFAYGTGATSPAACSCGYHALPGGPYRIFELGDKKHMESLRSKITTAIEKACASIEESSNHNHVRCIDISESSVCSVLASQVATEQAVEIVSVEEDSELSAFLYGQVVKRQSGSKRQHIYIEYNPLCTLLERELALKHQQEDWHGFDVVVTEPYTRAMSAFPLSTLANLIVQRSALSELLAANFVIVPHIARVKAQAILFPPNTMQNAFGAVHRVQGLDHSSFAELYDDSSGNERLSLPLFQYSCTAASQPAVLHEFDLCMLDNHTLTQEKDTTIEITATTGAPDAVKLWVEYDGEAPTRVARSEVMWLGEGACREITVSRRLSVRSAFRSETGCFEVSITAV